jgi:hypothetical protein
MMHSTDGIRYNILVSTTCAQALLEERIMLGQWIEEGGEGEDYLARLRATRPRE